MSNRYIQIVYDGSCLCDIAKKYNTTVQKIAELNNIDNVTAIGIGEILLIEV